jgi:type II secretory pathway component GspD/PulD (secretin)
MAELGEKLRGAQPVLGEAVQGAESLEDADPYALAEPGAVPEVQLPQIPPLLRQDPYIRFGERIIVRPVEGGEPIITKPYTLPAGKAVRLIELLDALQPFRCRPRPPVDPATGVEPPIDPAQLEYQVLENWDEEFYSDLTPETPDKVPAPATKVALSDVIVVTAGYGLLEQFEEFLDLFAAAGVPQIELEAKIIEVVESDTLDIGQTVNFTFGTDTLVQGAGFDLPNLTQGAEALLTLGAVQDSFTFDATLEAVRTWDNVQIDSRPKTVVRAGGVAYIESTTEIPYFEIKTLTTSGDFTSSTVYKKVGVQLYISPRIIGTRTLALDVRLIGSQQIGSQATFGIEEAVVEVPVIAYRTAKTLVYLEPGQTLVIGGLTTQRDRELINKVPLLGDIPLLGFLFRSTFTRTEKQHVLFAISPRIIQHSDFETEF